MRIFTEEEIVTTVKEIMDNDKELTGYEFARKVGIRYVTIAGWLKKLGLVPQDYFKKSSFRYNWGMIKNQLGL